MSFYDEIKGFDYKRFQKDHFGIGTYEKKVNKLRIKPGFLSWRDVASYFGMSPTVNEMYIRRGSMSKSMYECLSHLYGKETIDGYLPKPDAPRKPTREEQEIDDLSTLMFGTVKDVNAIRNK